MKRGSIAALMMTVALSASAKEYQLYPEFSERKVVFSAPPGMPHAWPGPYRNFIFRATRAVVFPELMITVHRLYGENPSDPKDYVEDFASFVDEVPKIMGQKDSPEPELTQVDAFNGSTTHSAPIWCIRSETYHDYLIIELIDQEIQVEITLEALDADELLDKIPALKAFTKSVRILPR